MKNVYVCDYCGRDDFKTAKECEEHEKVHKFEEMTKEVPGSIICPTCKGRGWLYGTDGVDDFGCDFCGGKGIVIPHHNVVRTITYKKI